MCILDDITPPEFTNQCLHCKARPADRHRGLCRSCYDDKSTRILYAPKRNTGNRIAFPDFNGEALAALAPTKAEPGSPERVEVLRKRFALKMDLFLNADYGWATASYARGYREDDDE